MTVVVSHSELATYRDCPMKWQLSYQQRWTREVTEDSPLGMGTLWHLVMETHYRTLRDWQRRMTGSFINPLTGEIEQGAAIPKSAAQKAQQACALAVSPLFSDPVSGRQSQAQERIEWMYAGYIQQYGVDPGWIVLGVEWNDRIPLPSASGGISNRYVLRVQLDLLVLDVATRKVWVVDHKSCGNLPKKRELDIDDQFGLYTWAVRQRGMNVMGAIHSAARTQRNVGDANGTKPMLLSDRFARTPMYRTEIELRNLAMDAARTARATRSHSREPLHSSPNPMECRWKCEFLDAHLAMRKGVKPSIALRDFGLYQAERNHSERL